MSHNDPTWIRARTLRASAAFLMLAGIGACGGGDPASVTSASSTPDAPSIPDAVYGDWHEDHTASTVARSVFVPQRVDLGPSRYRRTLHFGRDGSFSTLILDQADAHYKCPGTFVAVAPDALDARCEDPKTHKTRRYSIRILSAAPDRLVVQIKP